VRRSGQKEIVHLCSREEIVDYLAGQVRPGDLILTMGAGNIWMAGVELVQRLRSAGVRS
jgi:UDP-N-acetylmuramate--alanine ligase